MVDYSVAKSDTIIGGAKFAKEQIYKVEQSKDGSETKVSLKHSATGNEAIVIFGEQNSEKSCVKFTPNGILNVFNMEHANVRTDGKGNVNLMNTTNSVLNVLGDGTAIVLGSDSKTQTAVQPGVETTGYSGNNEYYSNWGWKLE